MSSTTDPISFYTMCDNLTPTSTVNVVKPLDLNVSAPVFVPLAKPNSTLAKSDANLVSRLSSGELAESQSGQIHVGVEDALLTPTPASISSFTEFVKNSGRDVPPPDSAETSMMSMTDDESDISSADIIVAFDEPKTPIQPLSQEELDHLDISPSGGVGGGVLCGISKPDSPAPEATTGNRVFEGLVPQDTNKDTRSKHKPLPPQRSCNIHIQNLPSHYGDTELSALCEEFGHTVSVRVFRRPVAAPPNRRLPDGQHSTYGFVLFDNVISAENCVNALRQRYKNIYPSFARQTAPAVHQPAFVGLLEAMAYGDLHQADPGLGAYTYSQDVNPGLDQPFYHDQVPAISVYNVPSHDNHLGYDTLPANDAFAYESVPEIKQPHPSLIPASVSSPAARSRPRALSIKPMPPPIESYVKQSKTTDRVNKVLSESSILLIVDGLPKDFGLLDTLFAPHAIHDVRLHRKGASDAVRGSVRVSSRLAALQSVEKLSGMQFGTSAGGLRVRLAEEVSVDAIDADSSAPGLPYCHTLPDIRDCQTLLAPPGLTDGPLSSSSSAPAVASMIGSGLNQLLFASDSNESLAGRLNVSPSTGRLLASPARLGVPFTPALASSISMPHVAPRQVWGFTGVFSGLILILSIRFLSPIQSYGLLSSLRVGNVSLPITNSLSSSGSLYASSFGLGDHLGGGQAVVEPPVIKVSSYASAVKKPTARLSSPENQKTKKRKSGRPGKKSASDKGSPEIESSAAMDKETIEEKEGIRVKDLVKKIEEKETANKTEEKKTVDGKKKSGPSSPEKSKSTSSKGKKWGSHRRSNTKSNVSPAVAKA